MVDDAYQHMGQREDGHNADSTLDNVPLYIPRERDRTLIHLLLAWSAAQEVRITAAHHEETRSSAHTTPTSFVALR